MAAGAAGAARRRAPPASAVCSGSSSETSSEIEPSSGSIDGTARNSPRPPSEKLPLSRAGSTRSGSVTTTGSAPSCRRGTRAADEPPATGCEGHLAGTLHDVEAQPKVVALERAARRRHLERRASVPHVGLVPKAERHRVAIGRRHRGGVRAVGRRASLDDPLHPFPGEREEVDARRVEAGVLSGRMRQWPFLSAGDDTRRRPHRPPATSVRAGRPSGDASIVRRRRRA